MIFERKRQHKFRHCRHYEIFEDILNKVNKYEHLEVMEELTEKYN